MDPTHAGLFTIKINTLEDWIGFGATSREKTNKVYKTIVLGTYS